MAIIIKSLELEQRRKENLMRELVLLFFSGLNQVKVVQKEAQ